MAVAHNRYRPALERSYWLLGGLMAGFCLIFLRLVYLQVLRHDYYMQEVAPLVDTRSSTELPPPGSILGRNGEPLAESVLLNTIIADPRRMQQNHESFAGAAQQLAPLLNRTPESIADDLNRRKDTNYVELAKWVRQDVADKVRDLRIKGLAMRQEWKREYPQGVLACHVLGGRDRFHRPLSGLEYHYRLLLDGQAGAVPANSDPLDLAGDASGCAVGIAPGKDLVLTIQPDLQRHVETEMDCLWQQQGPKWAACVIMDPRTGDILASSARPAYDPNDYVTGKRAKGCKWTAVPAAVTVNVPVASAIEQGSTFKILLAAAALEAGVVSPSSTFNCSGHINVGGRPISCWGEWASRGHGNLDVAGMLAQSCNVCAAQIGLKLGVQRYYDFLRRAGIGVDPEAGFPAEALGLIARPDRIRPRDLATMAFGQNVSCSGLQLTSIVSGIVNRGIMKHPHIVAAALNKDGSVFRQSPVSETRLCSEETSAIIRQMLQNVVENGTGKPVLMPDFKVGGKTGTAQQWDAEHGCHYTDRYMMSFIEIAPSDNPRYVIWVACNEPKVGRHGSDTAAPAARRLAEYALRHLDKSLAASQAAAAQTGG